MALQAFANNGIYVGSTLFTSTASSSIANAAGESITVIGRIRLEAGSGSKTISSAGGKVHWSASAFIFSDAGTNLRIGIQDVGATGIEDGTFDVYKDLVGGGGGVASSTINSTAMANGTKTIAHGDMIAVSFEMTARGGSDSITFNLAAGGIFGNHNFPYITIDLGSGPARNTSSFPILIEFDDGTMGWFDGFYLGHLFSANQSTFTYNSGSSPDEYAAMFKFPQKTSLAGAGLFIGSIASTDNFEIILYSDPLGTPVAQRTVTVDPNFTGGVVSGSGYFVEFSSPLVLDPDTYYAVALRPTTANSITFGYYDLGSGNEKFKKPCPFGTNIKLVGRTNQSGAFTETQTYHLPYIWLRLDKFDDGVPTAAPSAFTFS